MKKNSFGSIIMQRVHWPMTNVTTGVWLTVCTSSRREHTAYPNIYRFLYTTRSIVMRAVAGVFKRSSRKMINGRENESCVSGDVSKVLLHNACVSIGLIDCDGIFINIIGKITVDNIVV